MEIKLIPIGEYAEKHGVTDSTMRQRISRGMHPEAIKIGRNWLIQEDAPFVDNRRDGKSKRWKTE